MQIKRIHEYKRQLLNILETIALYNAIRAEPDARLGAAGEDLRRQGGGELSPGQADHQADQRRRARSSTTIRRVRGLLKVVFLPNYNVSLAEVIIPAADLSEQISTAGMEASGTGNMKLALNGALTIGTLDGANIEIRERVGADNIFIFGLTAEEVEAERAPAASTRADAIAASPALAAGAGRDRARACSRPTSPTAIAAWSTRSTHHDHFMVAADFDAYCGRAARGRRAVARPRGLVAVEHPEHRPDGLVLLRPHHPRIRRRHLGRAGEAALRHRGAPTRRSQPTASAFQA